VASSGVWWDEYRRRRRVAMFGLLGLPATVGLALIGRLPFWGFVGLTLVWTFWWGWAAFRAVRCPCPRCGKPYLASQDPLKRRCGGCGLQLYADL